MNEWIAEMLSRQGEFADAYRRQEFKKRQEERKRYPIYNCVCCKRKRHGLESICRDCVNKINIETNIV